MSDQIPSIPPQFGTAEYESAGADHCTFCNQLVGTQYYRVGDAMACGSCALRLKSEMPMETGGIYARSLIFGIGAAIVGMALYAAVAIATGWTIGFVSLAVGWLVGMGMVKGSGGFGGRKYQLTAVALTYFAVSVAAIPIYFSQMWKSGEFKQERVEGTKTSDGTKTDAAPESAPAPAPAPADEKTQPAAAEAAKGGEAPIEDGEQPGLGMVLLTLLLVGLASPFLALADPVRGLIGLVIIFVGLQIAWQKTAATALAVDGPFDNKPSADSATSGS